ncbi:MAG TPA: hypothetical protein VE093_00775 [Polyangiaceae bacterium]|nr:hypothetical protein [Polyangiaceae bacterium]
MKDLVVVAVLIVAFATLVTIHVSLGLRLVLRTRPRWRGVLALVVPPLAPIWAFREGWRKSGALWIGAVVVYLVALVAAQK